MASIAKVKGGYRARWRTPAGESRSKTFTRKVDAERHLTSVEHSKLAGSYIDPAASRTTVEAYYRTWSDRQPWRDSSADSVAGVFDRHVLPSLGRRPLGSIRRGDVEAWVVGLPVKASTARKALQYLGTMFQAAVDDGLIASNPARRAKRPKVERVPVVPMTRDELDRLLEAAPEWFAVAVTLGAAIGLRQGEATGLTVDRVSFLGREVTVDRQLVTPSAGGAPSFGPPKTATSYRRVPLADVAVEALARHVEVFGTGEHGLVLHEHGRAIGRQRFGKLWRQTRERAGLPAVRFHDTRHTFASTLLSGGVSVPAAAEFLGHRPGVLLDVYAHLIPGDHDRARAVVQAAFAERPVSSACHDGVAAGETLGSLARAPSA